MARIPDVERKLLNWARWIAQMRNGGGNFARTDLTLERVDGDGWDAPTVIPTDDGEAQLTDRAIAALERTLQQAVIDVYTGSGDVPRKARLAGVEVATLYARVDRAHKALARWFEADEQAKALERERVEQLQRTAVCENPVLSPAPESVSTNVGNSTLAAWLAKRRAGCFPP